MYRILIVIILMLPTFSHAINYLGFGGGNYVYAEQGNLYFNIDPYAFDNRSWTYDETKGFSAEIKVNMDLKTKYTSDDWLEQVVANKKSDGIMYANYIKQPFNYQNRGQYQHTWFWLARLAPTVGGFIGRTVAWNTFKNFALKNAAKNAVMGGALAYFLEAARTDGINCDEVDCTKTYNYLYVNNKVTDVDDIKATNGNTFRFTAEQFENKNEVARLVHSQLRSTLTTTPGVPVSLKDKCTWTSGYSFLNCNYAKEGTTSTWYTLVLSFMKEPKTMQELVSDPELLPYFDKTCKLFSSECVNEPTQGKNIKDVQLTGGVVGSPVSVIGPPYTNPITGGAQQDQVIIGGGSSGIGVNSG